MLCAEVGIRYAHLGEGALAMIWLPAGVALTALMICGIRVVPAIFLSSLMFNAAHLYPDSHGASAGRVSLFSLIAAIGETGFMLLSWYWFRQRVGVKNLRNSTGLTRFYLYPLLLSNVTGVAAQAVVYWIAGLVEVPAGATKTVARLLLEQVAGAFLASANGILTILPLAAAILLVRERQIFLRRDILPGIVALLAYVGLVAVSVFGLHPLYFLLLPAAVPIAIRFDLLGSATVVFITSVCFSVATVFGVGPFVVEDPWVSVFSAQLGLFGISTALLYLTAKQGELHEVNQGLEEAVANRTEELTRTNRQLEDLAGTDPLTGVSNRRRFEELVAKEISLAVRHRDHLALVLLDIDYFKQINDKHSHAAGDLVLREFTRLCSQVLRPYDIVARFGGDEFAILLPRTALADATMVAERLRLAVANFRIEWKGTYLKMSISVGVAQVHDTLAGALARADAALYRSKVTRNRVSFAPAAEMTPAPGAAPSSTPRKLTPISPPNFAEIAQGLDRRDIPTPVADEPPAPAGEAPAQGDSETLPGSRPQHERQ